jgi:hypothetical protein
LRRKPVAYNRKERDEGTDILTLRKKNEIRTTIWKSEIPRNWKRRDLVRLPNPTETEEESCKGKVNHHENSKPTEAVTQTGDNGGNLRIFQFGRGI